MIKYENKRDLNFIFNNDIYHLAHNPPISLMGDKQ